MMNLRELTSVVISESVPENLPNAKFEAIQRAMRRAVEEVSGFQVTGGTAVFNDETKEFLSLRTDGYVARWELIKQEIKGDSLEVTIKAWVRKDVLNKDLFFKNLPLEAIYAWVGKPRVAVAVDDLFTYESGGKAESQEIQFTKTQIENIFLEKSIRVEYVSPEIWNDPRQTTFDIGIKGTSTGKLSRKVDYGQGVASAYIYNDTLQIQGVIFPNRRIVLSELYFDPSMGKEIPFSEISLYAAFTPEEAFQKAVQRTVKERSWDIVGKTIKYWYEGLNKPKTISVIVKGISQGSEVDAIRKALPMIEDVVSETPRPQKMDEALFEVEYRGEVTMLADAIEKQFPCLSRIEFSPTTNQIIYRKQSGVSSIAVHSYTAYIKGLSLAQSDSIVSELASQVSRIERTAMANNTGTYNIAYAGDIIELAQLLERISVIRIKVIGYEDSRIIATIDSGMKKSEK